MTRTGRFAPSPTGPLHAGSLVAALASWLDVRARGPNARWLVRIEDADTERCLPGMGEVILAQLAACSLLPDEPPARQTQRAHRYEQALEALKTIGLAYPCGCSRRDIDETLARLGVKHRRHGERIYPGTCRDGLHGKTPRAWRFATTKFQEASFDTPVRWHDRRLGDQQQDVAREVGDFVLKRADGPWAYQLAVVVDDAEQGVTDVVRGEDLADNTARQILLQRALGFPTPSYLHTPLALGPDGDKLSKQNGARPLQIETPAEVLAALDAAARMLGLASADARSAEDALARWVQQWRDLYNSRP